MAITAKIEQPVEAVLLVRVGEEVREASPEDLAAFGYVKADKKSSPKPEAAASAEEDLFPEELKEFFKSFGVPTEFVFTGRPASNPLNDKKRRAAQEEARKQAEEFAKKVEEGKQEVNDLLKKGAAKAAEFFSKVSEDLDSEAKK